MNTITLSNLMIRRETLAAIQRAASASSPAVCDLKIDYLQGHLVGDKEQSLLLSHVVVTRYHTAIDTQQIPKDPAFIRLYTLAIEWAVAAEGRRS